jgi:hypothetical protein
MDKKYVKFLRPAVGPNVVPRTHTVVSVNVPSFVVLRRVPNPSLPKTPKYKVGTSSNKSNAEYKSNVE